MVKLVIFSAFSFAAIPMTTPIFLKQGFSTVLEFSSSPKKVVLGDSQSFQVEKMENSLVIKAMVPSAQGNLLVYTESKEPKVFLLTASDEAEPTSYRKIEENAFPVKETQKPNTKPAQKNIERALVTSAKIDAKGDFLSVDVMVEASSLRPILPDWDDARLSYEKGSKRAVKVWAERKEVLRDTKIKSRFIFAKPNVPLNLKGVTLEIPLKGEKKILAVKLGGL